MSEIVDESGTIASIAMDDLEKSSFIKLAGLYHFQRLVTLFALLQFMSIGNYLYMFTCYNTVQLLKCIERHDPDHSATENMAFTCMVPMTKSKDSTSSLLEKMKSHKMLGKFITHFDDLFSTCILLNAVLTAFGSIFSILGYTKHVNTLHMTIMSTSPFLMFCLLTISASNLNEKVSSLHSIVTQEKMFSMQ